MLGMGAGIWRTRSLVFGVYVSSYGMGWDGMLGIGRVSPYFILMECVHMGSGEGEGVRGTLCTWEVVKVWGTLCTWGVVRVWGVWG